MLRIERPLVAVLNQKHLTRACEWCFIWVPEGEEEAKTKLRACQGCRIVRYCSKVGFISREISGCHFMYYEQEDVLSVVS